MDAHEKESPLAILRPEDRGPASYPSLGVRGFAHLMRFDTVNSKKHSDRPLSDRRVGSDRIARPKEKPPGRAAGPDWSVGPNFWAWVVPAKEIELGRGPLTKGGQDRGAAAATASGRRFSPLDAATTAREGSGDGFGRPRCFAVVDRDLTGA
ncbi:hypothetical protein CRG98_014182 [Punica granatum]|uniref:Uncharacterized protein n=1 Tax=Punica granatum TaxID=22663 RepID=A0A2I0KBB7_PUNGR|nr:hypothetical protein CRG98_014182 [Punica granatum]